MPRPRFHNPWSDGEQSFIEILKWKLGRLEPDPVVSGGPEMQRPPEVIPLGPESMASAPVAGWRVTWLGHASFLVQGAGLSLLIDPIFSEFCSPLPIGSLRRLVPPPCSLTDLPPIDAILVTHGHYDHLDLDTLRAFGRDTRIITSAGHSGWLGRKLRREVDELGWHDSASLGHGVTLTGTPAQHFSARTPFDRNQSHWGGWLIDDGRLKLWHAGDSAYCPAFTEIGERHGPIDFGMIPIGAYSPRVIMRDVHMNPEEAVQAFIDARCRRAMGMHYGTFRLTDEPLGEPPVRLAAELRKRGIAPDRFTTGPVGGVWQVDGPGM